MNQCPKCGLPQFEEVVGYFGSRCMCLASWQTPIYKRLSPTKDNGCKPLSPLTEEDVRRIVREELARNKP